MTKKRKRNEVVPVPAVPNVDVVVTNRRLTVDERRELEDLRAQNYNLADRLERVEQVIYANADLLAEALREPQALHPAANEDTRDEYLGSMGINTVPQWRHVLTEAEQRAALDAAMARKRDPNLRENRELY